jgi:hypothetical protein
MLQFPRNWQWKWLTALLALGLLVIMAAAGACGDDGDSTSDGARVTPTATQEDDGEAPSPDGGGGDTDNGDSGDDDPASDLRRFGELAATASGRITYQFSSDMEGFGQGTMTFYFQPPDKSRFDLSSEEGQFIAIQVGNVSYFCSSDPTGGSCFTSTTATDEEEPFLPFFAEFASPEGIEAFLELVSGEDVDIRRFSQKIAGADASCFEASGVIEGESGRSTFCFGENGLLLLLDAASAESGTFRLEATDVGSVSDSDFEPPYEVIEFGEDFNFEE